MRPERIPVFFTSELLLVLTESKPHGCGRVHSNIASVAMAPGGLVHRDQHGDLVEGFAAVEYC